MKKLTRKKRKIGENRGVEYEKSMFPHGIKGITSYYHLVMHHWSSRKHGIQGYLMILGRENLKTCPFLGKKKAKKSKKSKKSRSSGGWGGKYVSTRLLTCE